MKIKLFLLIVLLSCFVHLFSQQPIEINNQFVSEKITEVHLINNSKLNFGLNNDWCVSSFKINTGSSLQQFTSIYLEVLNPKLDSIFTTITPTGLTSENIIIGAAVPFNKRTIKVANPCWLLNLKPNTNYIVNVYCKRKGLGVQVPIQILSKDSFLHEHKIKDFQIGIYFGALLLLFIFIYTLYYLSLEKYYLYYCLHILFTALWQISNFGIGFQYLWGNWPVWNVISRFIFSGLAIINFIAFTILFLNIPKHDIKVKYLSIIQYSIVGLIIIGCINYRLSGGIILVLTWVCYLVFLVTLIIIFYCGIVYFKKSANAKIFLYSFLVLALFSVLSILESVNIIHSTELNLYGIAIGNIIEILIITIGLSYTYILNLQEYQKSIITLYEKEKYYFDKNLKAIDEEQNRIASDLHDILGAQLAGIKLKTEIALMHSDNHKDIVQDIEQTYQQLRTLAKDLKTTDWNNVSLIERVKMKLDYIKSFSKIIFALNTKYFDETLLSNDVKQHVFAITNELIQNVLKHSKASHADILYTTIDRENFTISVKDDGVGLKPIESQGIGLRNIRERLAKVNGELFILNNKKGAEVIIKIKLNVT